MQFQVIIKARQVGKEDEEGQLVQVEGPWEEQEMMYYGRAEDDSGYMAQEAIKAVTEIIDSVPEYDP